MKLIAFVIWMIGWPISCAAVAYFQAKVRSLFGLEMYSNSVIGLAALVNTIIWIFIAITLWRIAQ